MKYTNNKNISLPLAVWLAHDEYAYFARSNVISATTLLKSIRQIILSSRLQAGEGVTDISMILASRIGTAMHSAIEHAWLENAHKSMHDLGYPNGLIESLKVNPKESDEDDTVVHLELRTERSIGNWIVSGSCDMICDFHVHDVKSTKVNTYIKGNKDDDYRKQLSIYKWLNPTLITEDVGFIEFIFTDWSLINSFHGKNYPQAPVLQHPINLLTHEKTEQFISNKLSQLDAFMGTPEAQLPMCSDKELWRDAPAYQYFSKVDNLKATKNFPTQGEANAYMLQKGKGVVKMKEGKAMACLYCNVASKCSQYANLLANNLIVMK